MVVAKGPLSAFVKVVCDKCKNEQIIFDKAATTVHCLVCGEKLANPTGGKAEILTKKVQTLN